MNKITMRYVWLVTVLMCAAMTFFDEEREMFEAMVPVL